MSVKDKRGQAFNTKIEFVMLFKDTCIAYPCEAYQYNKNLYVVPNEGLIWREIVDNVNMSEILKEIITWLVKRSGMKGGFFAMCQYLYRKVDTLSVIGSKKEQKDYIDTLLRHLNPLFKRQKGTISINTDVNFTNIPNQVEDMHIAYRYFSIRRPFALYRNIYMHEEITPASYLV